MLQSSLALGVLFIIYILHSESYLWCFWTNFNMQGEYVGVFGDDEFNGTFGFWIGMILNELELTFKLKFKYIVFLFALAGDCMEIKNLRSDNTYGSL